MLPKLDINIKRYNPIDALMVLCALTLIIVSHAVQIWTLDKSFIPSDEGWLMYLQSNAVDNIIVRGHLFFRFFPLLNELFNNRIVAFIIATCGQLVLAYGFYRWVKSLNARCNFFVVWGLVCMFSLNLFGVRVLNYPIFCDTLSALSIGLTLLGLANKKSYFFGLSGLFLSFLIPFKITTLVIAPIMLLAILKCSTKPLTALYYSIIGFLFGFIFYITCIETPSSFIQFLTDGINYATTKSDSSHSFVSIAAWTFRSIQMYLQWFLMAYFIMWLPRTVNYFRPIREHNFVKYAIIISFIAFIVLYFWTFALPKVRPHNFPYLLVSVTWTLAVITFAYLIRNKAGNYLYIVAMLLLSPLCVAFGTDVAFTIACPMAYINIIPALYVLLPNKMGNSIKLGLLTLMCLAIFNMLYPANQNKKYTNWNGDIYSYQNTPLTQFQNQKEIKVEKTVFEYLSFYKENIPSSSYMICSRHGWGIAYLLDLKSLDNNFRIEFGSKQIEACNKVLEEKEALYFIWDTIYPDDGQIAVIQNIIDYYSKLGYKVDNKDFNKHHLAVIYP